MIISAYIISILAIILAVTLLVFTLIPLFKKEIKIKQNKKTKTWFSIIVVTIVLEITSIVVCLLGEVSQYITPAPGYIWVIFKVFSLLFLWFWIYCYFFIWIKLKSNKK